tara:strand:+ start:24 stop:266 length:243 start_codon:yes stop_codon:yes gene_type:complete
MKKYAIVKNKKVYLNNWVGFKADIEQSGKIIKINGTPKNALLTLSSDDTYGFEGDYLNGETETDMEAKRCWLFEDERYEC